MTALSSVPELLAQLQSREPLLWLNPRLGQPLPSSAPSTALIAAAEARLARFAPLMATLFPELASSNGHIESQLMPAAALQGALADRADGAWFIKRDDELPVAGSIKARGGFHEVLSLAESIALEHGLLDAADDPRVLASSAARALFSQYSVGVGSTGNLGLSIGVMAAALGFDAVVHMSADAKAWKKERLRKRGVRVVEHEGDYAEAVAAGRAQALAAPRSHFVDDERSAMLFFGYAAAARHLARQLAAADRVVDAAHPLFVYLPCGVGGAPGGITYGLKALFGEHVHCFFAEPVASPCMLVQLASGGDAPVSVYEIGLDNRTEADGLAVGQASELVSPLMASQLAGVFTVPDDQLYVHLLALKTSMGVEIEPSAAAGIGGPGWLGNSPAGQAYMREHGVNMSAVTHVIWATGGSLVPSEELRRFQARAETLMNTVRLI
ncbi:D-serine ammonia-lyase [Aromatoleum petrolei]|uniref:Probable D-serine dehydratase n=1 Tax=Aromatoleum petrolei TaxID=76116 RepID=A0ABX1MST0_9RHOO|nr:D-serine ammonia-lyase [Aromatoleum petrolei]NMF89049.1 D-serine ammonia-lyase [Aromatoleum petrolei]QTQ38361.1 putative D-serine dehydratase [Aromatoleum petrolei]